MLVVASQLQSITVTLTHESSRHTVRYFPKYLRFGLIAAKSPLLYPKVQGDVPGKQYQVAVPDTDVGLGAGFVCGGKNGFQ